MALSDDVIFIAFLMQVDLPSGPARLCDGGVLRWGANMFDSEHPVLGSMESIDDISDGNSDTLPSFSVTLNPPASVASAVIADPNLQGVRVRFWMAEYLPALGEVTGTPELLSDMLIDQPVLRLAVKLRKVSWSLIARAQRLLMLNDGNVLSDQFHQRAWPGELGFANATGRPGVVAHGIAGPPRGTVNTGAGGGGYGGGSVLNTPDLLPF
jgi:hypothetical protein